MIEWMAVGWLGPAAIDWGAVAGLRDEHGLIIGAVGFFLALASMIYSRSQARGTKAQLKAAREQAADALHASDVAAEGARTKAAEALRAAELVAERGRQQAADALHAAGLVAESARAQAVEALRAASLVAQSAREQAVEALRAAGLVAEGARQQAEQALLAAELLANSEVSARVRDLRARNFRANPNLPAGIQAIVKHVGGPDTYAVMLDAMDVAQEIYVLRKRGLVSNEHWRMWMNDQMVHIAQAHGFQGVFQRSVDQGVLMPDFVASFTPVFDGKRILDPSRAGPLTDEEAELDDPRGAPQPNGDAEPNGYAGAVEYDIAEGVAPRLVAERKPHA